MKLPPAMVAGATTPSGRTSVSPETLDLVNRLRDHYRSQGKASAAHNYSRHLRAFFGWCENQGYHVRNLPTDAVESFLSSLSAAGQKETTTYVMRTQLKSALREAATVLGLEVGHLEYQTGKPPEVRRQQKAKEKAVRHQKRIAQSAQTLQAIQQAQTQIYGAPLPIRTPSQIIVNPPQPQAETEQMDATTSYEEPPMSDQSAPAGIGAVPAGGSNNASAPNAPIVINMPSQGPTRPMSTIGASANPQNRPGGTPQPQRGVVLNNFTFNGPYIRVSRMADGSDPLTPPGTEVFVQTFPSAMIAPHGDIASFLQSYLIPKLRLPPMVSQVHFIFNELNDKRQPTGKRDEMVVSVPGSDGMSVASAPAQVPRVGLGGLPFAASNGGMDSTTNYLLQKLDREAEEAKARAEKLQDEMKKASDAQTTFILMQQFQKEQDLRRQIEEDRRRVEDRMQSVVAAANAPALVPQPMPFPQILPPEQPRDNSAAEIAKAMNEANSRMMELMLASMNRPQPVAPPQKDVSEWLIPFIAQMNQQAQQQAQAQQQMMMQQQNQTVQILQAMLTRENPTEKLLMMQLQEVKAAANAPKADELESFADKLQKMKMVSDMLGGNSGPGFLSELLANADTIGAGAAKVIAAAKTQTPAGLNGVRAGAAPQLPAAQTAAATAAMPAPPPETLAHLQQVVEGVDTEDVQKIVNNVIDLIKTLLAQPETTPFPSMGRRMLAAFQNAEDEGELYTLAKNLWKQLGQPYDRPAAKVVASVLAQWYSVIHQHLFGEPKELAADGDDEEGGEDGDEELVDGEADGVDSGDEGPDAAASGA